MDQFDLMFLDEMRDFFGLPENTKAKNFTQLSDIGHRYFVKVRNAF